MSDYRPRQPAKAGEGHKFDPEGAGPAEAGRGDAADAHSSHELFDHEAYDRRSEVGNDTEGGHNGSEDNREAYYDYDHEGWPVVDDRGGPGPHRARRRRKRRGLRHPLLITLAALLLLIVVVLGGGYLWVDSQINPGGKRGPAVSVAIPKGASTSKIGDLLASAGVIHNGTIFAYYVRLHGDGPLYPGTYTLQKNSPYSAAIAALEAGPKIPTDKLVIPEGYTLRQIADAVGALPHMGLSASKFLTAAEDGAVRSPYEPAGVNNLEGLVFPDTYEVKQGETELDVLEQMVGEFNQQASQVGLEAAAARLGFTPYQLVTVASIVERESKLPGDRGPVASALYNRLRIGMPLGADSTQTYYLRLTDPTLQPTPLQLDQPSPYNTRINKGLPPTPISNPGLSSLQAAANPPTTSYLYFVEINPDGKLGFASTASGFDSLQRQCRAAGLC